jgi:hypothetical protein
MTVKKEVGAAPVSDWREDDPEDTRSYVNTTLFTRLTLARDSLESVFVQEEVLGSVHDLGFLLVCL